MLSGEGVARTGLVRRSGVDTSGGGGSTLGLSRNIAPGGDGSEPGNTRPGTCRGFSSQGNTLFTFARSGLGVEWSDEGPVTFL